MLVKDIIVLSQCSCQSYNDIDTETYSEPSQTSEMKPFAKIVNGRKPLTIFPKCPILDILQGFEYTKETFLQLSYIFLQFHVIGNHLFSNMLIFHYAIRRRYHITHFTKNEIQQGNRITPHCSNGQNLLKKNETR